MFSREPREFDKPLLLLTGRPGVGKTTVARRLAGALRHRGLAGFYTEEVRERGRRRGFRAVTFDGWVRVIADVAHPGPARVGRYGVDVAAIDALARRSLAAVMHSPAAGGMPAHRWDDRELCEGHLVSALRSLFERFHRLCPQPFALEPEGPLPLRRARALEEQALREALLNLVAHQDYADVQRTATVLWWSDRVVFYNPGDSYVATEDLWAGGFSETRNPLIARVLRQAGLAEQAGSGLPLIRRTWDETGRPPRIRIHDYLGASPLPAHRRLAPRPRRPAPGRAWPLRRQSATFRGPLVSLLVEGHEKGATIPYRVFAASATDVAYLLEVTDTASGLVRELGQPQQLRGLPSPGAPRSRNLRPVDGSLDELLLDDGGERIA